MAHEGVVRAGYEIFTPKIRTRVGARWRTTSLFGSYFFVRVIDQWRTLERTIGVLNVVKAAGVPARALVQTLEVEQSEAWKSPRIM